MAAALSERQVCNGVAHDLAHGWGEMVREGRNGCGIERIGARRRESGCGEQLATVVERVPRLVQQLAQLHELLGLETAVGRREQRNETAVHLLLNGTFRWGLRGSVGRKEAEGLAVASLCHLPASL
ncbi:hypothetical protein ACSSS7_006331 [Eimeria intestinalis]